MQQSSALRAVLKGAAATMAAFASSGAAASGLTRSTQRSALVLQRLLPQIGEATPRLPCLQTGRLGFTTATAPRRQLCCAHAAQSRRDMSAHAAAVSALLHRTRPLKAAQRVEIAHAPPPSVADSQHSQRRGLLPVDQHWGHTCHPSGLLLPQRTAALAFWHLPGQRARADVKLQRRLSAG